MNLWPRRSTNQAVIHRLLLSSLPQVARHPACPCLDESAAMLSATARRQRCQRAKAQRLCRIMQEVTCFISEELSPRRGARSIRLLPFAALRKEFCDHAFLSSPFRDAPIVFISQGDASKKLVPA